MACNALQRRKREGQGRKAVPGLLLFVTSMKRFTLTAWPVPSCLAWPWEADLLQGKSVTVELVCSSMGKINRNRIHRLVLPELRKQFGHICRIGGYRCGVIMGITFEETWPSELIQRCPRCGNTKWNFMDSFESLAYSGAMVYCHKCGQCEKRETWNNRSLERLAADEI